jgi:hypothetical protein
MSGLKTINLRFHALIVRSEYLGQWKFARVIDGVGGSSHVSLPRIRAGLASTARILSPPKAPPISAPEVPMFTLAMPQSDPALLMNSSAS